MDGVLDTVSVNHLLRKPKKTSGKNGPQFSTSLDDSIRSGDLRVIVDDGGALTDEWGRTSGAETIRVLITHWDALNAFFVVRRPTTIPGTCAKTLRSLGFGANTVDKLVLRLAYSVNDAVIVSD